MLEVKILIAVELAIDLFMTLYNYKIFYNCFMVFYDVVKSQMTIRQPIRNQVAN